MMSTIDGPSRRRTASAGRRRVRGVSEPPASLPPPVRPDTVFLDRDGTINVRAPVGDYVKTWDEFQFLPGAPEAIRGLADEGLRVIVVTNQRGIARGLMTAANLDEIHARMLDELAGAVSAVYYCPHDEGACDCRKPRTGMFVRAAHQFPEIELARSAVIGDSAVDVEAARAVGALAVLVGPPCDADADITAPSLADAVALLLD